MNKIKLLVADDHALFKRALIYLLNSCDRFEVIATANNGLEILKHLSQIRPHIILMDLRMPLMNGFVAIEEVRRIHPNVKILVLTMMEEEQYIINILKLGANGVLSKNCAPETLFEAIFAVKQQDYYMKNISHLIHKTLYTKQKSKLNGSPLSLRETAILKEICDQKTSLEISQKLHLSPRTIEGYRKTLLQKTGSRNTVGLVKFAVQKGIVD